MLVGSLLCVCTVHVLESFGQSRDRELEAATAFFYRFVSFAQPCSVVMKVKHDVPWCCQCFVVVIVVVVVVVIVVEVEISSCCILRDYSLLRNYNCFDFDFDSEFDNKQYSNIEYNIEYFIP